LKLPHVQRRRRFGASLAPYIAAWLATNYGLQFVGYYLSLAAILTLIGPLLMGDEGPRSGGVTIGHFHLGTLRKDHR